MSKRSSTSLVGTTPTYDLTPAVPYRPGTLVTGSVWGQSKDSEIFRTLRTVRRIVLPLVISLALLLVIPVGVVAAANKALNRGSGGCGATPTFVGMTMEQADQLVGRCHYSFEEIYRVPDSAPSGKIVSQSPPFTGNRLVVSTGPLKHPWAILSGAKKPPVRAECTATLQLDQDGNAGPLSCRGDHVNVEAWDYFARNHFAVMSLPRESFRVSGGPVHQDAFRDSAHQ